MTIDLAVASVQEANMNLVPLLITLSHADCLGARPEPDAQGLSLLARAVPPTRLPSVPPTGLPRA